MFKKITAKIQDWDTALASKQAWQTNKKKVVFTNGCFDILHFGHIHYLAEARSLGDYLIVGLNSTDSVRRLKGQHRPINDIKTRLYLLAALECVDAVVIFEEDTPLELIELLQPDVLVKGGDWQPEQIVGAEVVLKNGGEVRSLPYIDGYSTTSIEARIQQFVLK